MCFILVHGPSSSKHYPEFSDETSDVLQMVKANERTILLGYFNAHVGNYATV